MRTATDMITNDTDIIDSRDVIERIAELEGIAAPIAVAGEEGWQEGLDEAERGELAALKALADAASDYAEDWENGTTLIRDSYFTTYAQQYAEDIGAISDEMSWPATCIDWEQAADELKCDYTCIDYDGVSYWVR